MAAAAAYVTGDRALDRKLRSLAPAVARKVLRQAMRRSLGGVRAAAKAEVPVRTGATRQSIKIGAPGKRRRGVVAVEVRTRADAVNVRTNRAGRRYFIPAVIEYGHDPVAPDPFMRRAYESAGPAAEREALALLKSGIEREAAR